MRDNGPVNARAELRLYALAMALMISSCSARVEYHDNTAAAAGAININKAAVEELETLPGVGRKTAEAIVLYRDENGPFRRAEHLMLVRGVSEERFLAIRSYIRTDK